MIPRYEYTIERFNLENEVGYELTMVDPDKKYHTLLLFSAIKRNDGFLLMSEIEGNRFFHGTHSSDGLDTSVLEIAKEFTGRDFMKRLKLKNERKNE